MHVRGRHGRHVHLRRLLSGGWLLVSLIVLLGAVLLGAVGLSFLLAAQLRVTSLHDLRTRAVYLAQAGAARAIRDFRQGTGISLAPAIVVAGPAAGSGDDDLYEVDGPEADHLLVNMRANVTLPAGNSLCSADRSRLQGWFGRNVRATGQGSVRVDEMRLNWEPVLAGEGVLRLDLNGNGADWTSPCGAPAGPNTNINIPNHLLSPGARWNNASRVWFTSNTMNAKDWIDVVFIMRDGSERTARYHVADVAQRTADFTLRAVGTARRGLYPVEFWRRLRIEYRICRVATGTACNDGTEEEEEAGAVVGFAELAALTP